MIQKSPEAFRTISEVAEDLDVPQHVLRFWESKFSQVRPLKRGGGRRYYRPEDVDLLRGIRTLLYDDGYTIKGVQKVFRDQGVRHVMDAGRDGATLAAVPSAEATAEPMPAPPLEPEDRTRVRAVLADLTELRAKLDHTRRLAGDEGE